jgi:hypothetical protein
MSTTDLSDMLGGASSRRRVGRPTKEEALARAKEADRELPHYSEFRKPVGVTFLASVAGKQPRQISKRLERCPVAEWTVHQGKQVPLYDFLTALAYLIPPRGNIEDWFAQQNAASLPPFVNKLWWDSAHQRNRVMMASNDLWHTEDVMLVLGRVAMMIQQQTRLWIEDLPEKELLTDEQYAALLNSTNRLTDDIRTTLVNMPRETLSMTAHIQSELDTSSRVIADSDRAPEVDDDVDE